MCAWWELLERKNGEQGIMLEIHDNEPVSWDLSLDLDLGFARKRFG